MGPDPLPPPLGGAKGGKQSGRADIERTAEGEQGPPGRGPTAGLYSRYGYTAGIEGPHREIRDRFGERTGDSIQALGIGGRRLVPGMTRSAVTLLLFSLFSLLCPPPLTSLTSCPPGERAIDSAPGRWNRSRISAPRSPSRFSSRMEQDAAGNAPPPIG